MKSFSIVIPAYNEADNLAALIEEIYAVLGDTHAFEILVVDDGSQDETPQRLNELRRQRPTLRVIRHARNSGQSAALLTGVRATQAAWIVTLDGDGQNDPTDILKFLDTRDHHDPAPQLIIGYRKQRQDRWLRRFSTRVANTVRAGLLKDQTPDTGCGIKLFRRDTFLAIPHFNHMHRFLPALFQRQGGTVVTLPVNHRPRLHGQSKYGIGNRLWVGIIDLLGVLWLQRRPCHANSWEEEN
ncbi:MAG: glycosyltransferase family 2 protein [Gammaproteobacteria bacterium]|nr:glycosyltransferase family 2 protein [Gammaproteobacteria bacterium]MCP5458036.1 glycosyltransferase family 2 protein [Gammaproteobacteria bacterium]